MATYYLQTLKPRILFTLVMSDQQKLEASTGPSDPVEITGSKELHPQALLSRLELPRFSSQGENDPILLDIMKLTPHTTESISLKRVPLINRYSFQLQELLRSLDETKDDSHRINIESQLHELTTFVPQIDPIEQGKYQFPSEHLLRVIIENYKSLLKISSTYFNLSLASHITRYLVSVVYALRYWEVYHLLYLLPDLEYFLKLCGLEVIQTSFGPLVKPPTNYLEPHMAQGVDYPFPYPFYNYSFHLFDKESTSKKFDRISIKSYIDITLKNNDPPRKSQQIKPPPTPTPPSPPPPPPPQQQQQQPVVVSNNPIRRKSLTGSPVIGEEITTDYSDSDDDKSIRDDMSEEARKQQKTKTGVIHQCHLLDPNSLTPCLKIFYGKNELLRHQEFVHATKKKIYKCIYCLRNGTKVSSYPRHDSLARHIRRKHGITGKENKMAVNYAKENVEIIDDPGKFAQAQAQAQAQARARAQAQANVVAQAAGPQTLQPPAPQVGGSKTPTMGSSPVATTTANTTTTTSPNASRTTLPVSASSIAGITEGLKPGSNISEHAHSSSISNNPPPRNNAARSNPLTSPTSIINKPYPLPSTKLSPEIQQLLPSQQSLLLYSQGLSRSPMQQPMLQTPPSHNLQKLQQPPATQGGTQPQQSPNIHGIPSQTPYVNVNPEYGKVGFNGFLNFNLKDINLSTSNRAPLRLSNGSIESVNFNKPESSALKDNFQKFRITDSLSHGGSIHPGPGPGPMLGSSDFSKKLPFMEDRRPQSGGPGGVVGGGHLPPPSSLGGSGQRLPGLNMYLKPEWEQRPPTGSGGNISGIPPSQPPQLSRGTPPHLHQTANRMNNGQPQVPGFVSSQFPQMHLPMLRDNHGDGINHRLPNPHNNQ